MKNGGAGNWGIRNCKYFLNHYGPVLIFMLLMSAFGAAQQKKNDDWFGGDPPARQLSRLYFASRCSELRGKS